MKRVTGIGGVFFRAKDPEKMREWYSNRLGIPNMTKYGGVLDWKRSDKENKYGHTVWSPMDENTKYLDPSKSQLMVNYRFENLEELLKFLKEKGVDIVGEVEVYDYGKFGWILDPEGNKIELWEPSRCNTKYFFSFTSYTDPFVPRPSDGACVSTGAID